MVTEEDKREIQPLAESSPLRYSPSATPKLVCATGPIADAVRFKLTTIRPREGRTAGYLKWVDDVEQLLLAHGVTPRHAKQGPPIVTPLPEGKLTTRSDTERYEREAKELDNWQKINTSIFWHVRPSLLIDGPTEPIDRRSINALLNVETGLADGRGLIAWAQAPADLTTVSKQSKIRIKVAQLKLAVTSAAYERWDAANKWL